MVMNIAIKMKFIADISEHIIMFLYLCENLFESRARGFFLYPANMLLIHACKR